MEPRAYQSSAAGTPPPEPVGSIGYPVDATSTAPATEPGAYWFYMVGEELRNVLVGTKLAPDPYNLGQLLQAILAIGASV